MKFYFLAFLIWILEIVMFASIVLIPVVMYLRDNYDWFERPFNEASYTDCLND